ncbi:hypothetical protein [Bartonella sp. ML70XJBT]|uniref:hypothetical protein n=1 Tax=Bartonella sp. ML70XJBT TaxID=3019096 RepID=UPI0023626997|nr:hypothetical protein [Bartonella sp. ML70XJBT]
MDKNCTKKHAFCELLQVPRTVEILKAGKVLFNSGGLYSYTSVKIEEFKGLIVITFTRRYREIGGESLERCLFKTSVPVILQ